MRGYFDVATMVFSAPRFAFFRPLFRFISKATLLALVQFFILLLTRSILLRVNPEPVEGLSCFDHKIWLFIPNFNFIFIFHVVILELVILNAVHDHADAVFFINFIIKNLLAVKRFAPDRKEFLESKITDFF